MATKAKTATKTEEKKVPLFRKKIAGHVYCSCWANKVERENDGKTETFTVHNFELYRRYQDSNGKWKTSHYLGLNDLPKAQLALAEAYKELALIKGVEAEE